MQRRLMTWRMMSLINYMNEEEPHDIARGSDSDDDHPVGELTESDVEIMKCFLPSVDIRVHEFRNLELSS
jgi:hypothetical protein